MQLAKKNQIFELVAMASCSLLGVTNVSAGDVPDSAAWKVDTALLYYDEQDRVNAVEPVISVSKKIGEDSKFSANLTLDTLSGSSHNGAALSNVAQTFTSPSGEETYDIKAGDVPLDPNFEDQRTSLNAQIEQSISRLSRISYGAAISSETDYQSLSVNGGFSRDFNLRNTTLSAGLSLTNDVIDPRDGVPVPLSMMSKLENAGDEERSTVDLLLGVTQVMNRNTVMQFNYGIGSSDGYHNDPYKIVSMVDRVTGNPLDYVYENRPDTRTKHSFFWRTKYHLEKDMIDASWRYMTDDWGVDSHTLDFRYRWKLSENSYLEPHIRYYTQTSADFYREEINSAEPVPLEVSADYRLGSMETSTVGVKWATTLKKGHELSLRFELYQQSGDTKAADLSSVISQVGYTFYY